ncbi:hypothetical protein HDU81_010357 [Chytriomyces hyalinus]|nr:hypothetical protein HDU81_010357 [Chytriomyces hyalinus]
MPSQSRPLPPHPPMKPFRGHLSWHEVRDTVDTLQLHRFSRTPAVTASYLDYLHGHVKRYFSVSDCVKVETLGFPAYYKDGLIHAVPVEKAVGWKVRPWTLTLNRFPYALNDGVEHWVLWSIGPNELSTKQIETILRNQLDGTEFCYLANPPSLKSVPDIHHWHVFVRRV